MTRGATHGHDAAPEGHEPDAAVPTPEPAPDAAPAATGDAAATTAADPRDAELATLRERAERLERELGEERERSTDYMRKWQVAQADHANFRRRAQQEQEQMRAWAAAQSLALMLPALDSLERAFKTLPDSLRRLTWIEGVALVELQLRGALQAQGVEPFEPTPGEALDPTRHQAVAQEVSAAHPEGAIVEVVQRGYVLQGRTLRPALVSVAAASASAPDSPVGASGGRPREEPAQGEQGERGGPRPEAGEGPGPAPPTASGP